MLMVYLCSQIAVLALANSFEPENKRIVPVVKIKKTLVDSLS